MVMLLQCSTTLDYKIVNWLIPIHPSDREAVKQHLRELLDAEIIRESESPFA